MAQPGPVPATVAAVRTVQATRYVTPLREGGSLPGLVEADDDGLYVLKFRGAGQGAKALVAEVVAGELARSAGLPVPEIVFAELDPELGRAEPDPEIQELIAASGGRNVALDFLPGALTYNPAAGPDPSPEQAAEIVWLDALTTNVDRSPQNPNLLLWHGRMWLIDHGAALYLQHSWEDPPAEAGRPFPAIRGHVLLPFAGDIMAADERLAPRLGPAVIDAVLAAIPPEWFAPRERSEYAEYLRRRLRAPRAFAGEAEEARRAA
jgi:HipA-like kinase